MLTTCPNRRTLLSPRPSATSSATSPTTAANQRSTGLSDLAHERDDVGELNELLDEGSELAGSYLAQRAISARDLRELQRLADEGIEDAAEVLEQFLR